METLLKLMKHFHFMVFSFAIISILLLFSCKRQEDAWNKVIVINSTSDTLLLKLSKKHISEIGEDFIISPNNETTLAVALYTSGFGIIEDNFGDSRDTIEIYRNDSLFVKWGGPLISLPDSIHSFYNKNSWTKAMGGNDNEYEIMKFTINATDLRGW
jgi:hypothetical protein